MLAAIIEIMSLIIVFFLCVCGVAYLAIYSDIYRLEKQIKELEEKVKKYD